MTIDFELQVETNCYMLLPYLVESLQLSDRGCGLFNIQALDGNLPDDVALLKPVGSVVVHDHAVACGAGLTPPHIH